MKFDVKYEKTWSEETLKAWMDDPEDDRWDELSSHDWDELYLLSLLRQDAAYRDVDIAVLHEMAEDAIDYTLDFHMSDIIERILSLRELRYELNEIKKKHEKSA